MLALPLNDIVLRRTACPEIERPLGSGGVKLSCGVWGEGRSLLSDLLGGLASRAQSVSVRWTHSHAYMRRANSLRDSTYHLPYTSTSMELRHLAEGERYQDRWNCVVRAESCGDCFPWIEASIRLAS